MQSISNNRQDVAPVASRMVVRRAIEGWERLAFAEVLVPNTPNVYGDYWTEQAIADACYTFMRTGFGLDIEHNNIDVLGEKVHVVEVFIARENDPDFIKGSWVVGVLVDDDELWQNILDGKINGFSYQAEVMLLPAVLETEDDGVRTGTTEPSTTDGHTHEFVVLVDGNNRPTLGNTSFAAGHSHNISNHTVTDKAFEHVHRYTLVTGVDGK